MTARFDRFVKHPDTYRAATNRVIAGYAVDLHGRNNFALLSVDHLSYDNIDRDPDWQVKLTVQLSFSTDDLLRRLGPQQAPRTTGPTTAAGHS